MKNWKLKIRFLSLIIASMAIVACTDLEIEETDAIFTEDASGSGNFEGVADVQASVDGLYSAVYGQIGNQADLYALNEVTSDELLVPTRGTDWGDNGVWRSLHAHTWDANHAFVLNTWNNLNQNIFNASLIIDERSGPDALQEAEARFLRAWNMFWIVDLYGQQPLRGADDGPSVLPQVMSRAEATDLLITDLEFALTNLPISGPSGDNNRANRSAAAYLLAKVLLNANIYRGTSPDVADMNRVVELINTIEADGYGLVQGYFDIFDEDIDSETIWFAQTGVGNRIWNTLHYNQNAPSNTGGGWNGWSTLSEFYDLFEGPAGDTNAPNAGQEERRGFVPTSGSSGAPDDDGDGFADASNIGFGFLLGNQYNLDGTQVLDRPGALLTYTREFSTAGLVGNNEQTGIRVIKYHPRTNSFRNHEIVFRYSDAHLMRAEAILRGASGDATAEVNELRTIRGASPLGNVGEQEMLDERGRELYAEFWRRQDQIRFGTFDSTWGLKDVTEDFRALFPIPASALFSNPNLVQNPGY